MTQAEEIMVGLMAAAMNPASDRSSMRAELAALVQEARDSGLDAAVLYELARAGAAWRIEVPPLVEGLRAARATPSSTAPHSELP